MSDDKKKVVVKEVTPVQVPKVVATEAKPEAAVSAKKKIEKPPIKAIITALSPEELNKLEGVNVKLGWYYEQDPSRKPTGVFIGDKKLEPIAKDISVTKITDVLARSFPYKTERRSVFDLKQKYAEHKASYDIYVYRLDYENENYRTEHHPQVKSIIESSQPTGILQIIVIDNKSSWRISDSVRFSGVDKKSRYGVAFVVDSEVIDTLIHGDNLISEATVNKSVLDSSDIMTDHTLERNLMSFRTERDVRDSQVNNSCVTGSNIFSSKINSVKGQYESYSQIEKSTLIDSNMTLNSSMRVVRSRLRNIQIRDAKNQVTFENSRITNVIIDKSHGVSIKNTRYYFEDRSYFQTDKQISCSSPLDMQEFDLVPGRKIAVIATTDGWCTNGFGLITSEKSTNQAIKDLNPIATPAWQPNQYPPYGYQPPFPLPTGQLDNTYSAAFIENMILKNICYDNIKITEFTRRYFNTLSRSIAERLSIADDYRNAENLVKGSVNTIHYSDYDYEF